MFVIVPKAVLGETAKKRKMTFYVRVPYASEWENSVELSEGWLCY
jgi:hypothetical protein